MIQFARYSLIVVLVAVSAGGAVAAKNDGGIIESIPKEYQAKYEKWKEELLGTDFGRQQWEQYANNKQFRLTIVVSGERKYGAATGGYEWTPDGKLTAATITLGKNLDKGYPDPVYYPVMNSLAAFGKLYEISGNILASAKIAHEIAHVNFAAKMNSQVFQRQDSLIASYNKIFLKNGYNTRDPRLSVLTEELGANPIEIWEDREYWSEVGAMRFLSERLNKEPFYCSVFTRMKRNINNYARNYQYRFQSVVEDQNTAACGS